MQLLHDYFTNVSVENPSKKAQEKIHLDEIEKLFSERHIYKIPLLPKDMASNEVMLLSKYFDE